MNTLSKAQVIALFIGSASAADQTAMGLLNGPTVSSQIPTATDPKDQQAPLPANSGTACTGNATCTTSGEKCGAFQIAGATETSSYCVQETMCGALGYLNGAAWSLQCWADPAEAATPVAPAAVDPAALVTALEGLITKPTVSWTEKNILVSPKFNWMDGWYIQNETSTDPNFGKFVEVDKPADNRCFLDVQCPDVNSAKQCCALYPDSNNRRCIALTAHNILQKVGPVSFTPTCPSQSSSSDGTEVAPENAQDDIAKGALADASEALNSFWTNQVNDKKTAAGYDTMNAEAKTAFDAQITAEKAANDAVDAELKTAMGYAETSCDDNCKAFFEADLLKWRKNVYELCKANDKQIACTKAKELRLQEETARKGATDGNYYSGMTGDQRTAFDKGFASQADANKAAITAVAVAENKPKSGESGFACVESACVVGTEKYWCCGTSNRVGNIAGNTEGQLTKVCARVDSSGTDTRYTGAWEDFLGVKYQHTCELAQKLVATAAATVAAAYTLM